MNFLFAVEMAAALDDGESKKKRKPKERRPARTMVIGFVRRKDRGRAMLAKVRIRKLQAVGNPACSPNGQGNLEDRRGLALRNP